MKRRAFLALPEGKTVESIRSILDTKDFFENDKTGFGGRIFAQGNDYGSTSIRVRGFTFDGDLAWVRVTVQFYSSVWPSVLPRLMATWVAERLSRPTINPAGFRRASSDPTALAHHAPTVDFFENTTDETTSDNSRWSRSFGVVAWLTVNSVIRVFVSSSTGQLNSCSPGSDSRRASAAPPFTGSSTAIGPTPPTAPVSTTSSSAQSRYCCHDSQITHSSLPAHAPPSARIRS